MPGFLHHQLVDRCEQQGRPLLRRRGRHDQFEQELVIGDSDGQPLVQWRIPSALRRCEQQKGLPQRLRGHQTEIQSGQPRARNQKSEYPYDLSRSTSST
jgi:hypothetical protein